MQHRSHVPHRNPLARIRVQLPLGILVAGLIPYVVRLWAWSGDGTLPSVNATLVVTLAAVVLGFYLLRSISVFPGINSAYYVAPCFLASFGLATFGLVVARIDYSRSVLFSSLALSIAVYTLLFTWLQRNSRMRIGVVPFGATDRLVSIRHVDWQWLRTVDEPKEGLNSIVADFRADLPDEWERMLADCALAGMIVYHLKQLEESLTGRVEIEHLSENSFGSLVPLAAYLRLKLIVDFLAALFLLGPVLFFLAIVALLIKIDSRGPVIFRQERVGYRGRPFTVYKLRTMRHEPAPEAGCVRSAVTVSNDARITRLGRFLRRSRIDELPQIVNVLKGEMSWIGPRPEARSLSEWYERELPFYRYRHVVRPGITGWAQVNQGHVAEVEEVREKLQNDFYYIKFFSPWLDLVIVIKTLHVAFSGFGSR